MYRPPSRSADLQACAVFLCTLLAPADVSAQACCAGGSVVTPARLELHEKALVGLSVRGSWAHGSYTREGSYLGAPPGGAELDFEEDVFAAVRVFDRGQIALLAPFVQTYRRTSQDGAFVGGGLGDANVSIRYDFVGAGEHLILPGVAVLGGVTVPTGTAPEADTRPLDVGATGIGAYQFQGALAFEQTFGPWLVNATWIASFRTARFGETLAPQMTALAAGAYTLPNDAALALSLSYAFEGEATGPAGAGLSGSSKRRTTVTASALWPASDAWRVLGALFLDPPLPQLGSNQAATTGVTLTVVRSWS